MEIIQDVYLDHNGTKLEINTSKITGNLETLGNITTHF